MKKKRYIFSQKLAGLLMLKGFVLKEMRPDKHNPSRNVFVFNNSEELEKVLDGFNRKDVLNDYFKDGNNNSKWTFN